MESGVERPGSKSSSKDRIRLGKHHVDEREEVGGGPRQTGESTSKSGERVGKEGEGREEEEGRIEMEGERKKEEGESTEERERSTAFDGQTMDEGRGTEKMWAPAPSAGHVWTRQVP